MSSGKSNRLLIFLLLHVLLVVFSFGGVFSKMASGFEFFSFKFCACYGGLILILGIYAICWQQIIKRIPLTLAYANKAVTVIWGMVWGVLFFNEAVTVTKITGAVIVIAGVVLYSLEDNKKDGTKEDTAEDTKEDKA